MPTLALDALPVPLQEDETGSIRIGRSRVLLDVVMLAFDNGASPEAIAEAYNTLELADVYAVIAFYLRNQKEVREYLRRREQEGEELRRKLEARQPAWLREKLLGRQPHAEQSNVASAH